MELNQLRYFYEVARAGSFTQASRRMRVSQPAISKQVLQLERKEGYKFLDRRKRGVGLTPMGQILFERCDRIFGEFQALKETMRLRQEECGGELWVGASDNLCQYVLPQLLATFLKSNPTVRLSLFSGVSDTLRTKILDCSIEMALFYTLVKDRELNARKIAEIDFCVVAAPSLVGKKLTIDNLRGLRYIGSLTKDYVKPYPALQLLRRLKVEPASLVEVNLQEAQKQMALHGIGYTVVPAHMVKAELEKGLLVRLPTRMKAPLYLILRRNRTLSRAAERWIQSIETHFNLSGSGSKTRS